MSSSRRSVELALKYESKRKKIIIDGDENVKDDQLLSTPNVTLLRAPLSFSSSLLKDTPDVLKMAAVMTARRAAALLPRTLRVVCAPRHEEKATSRPSRAFSL